MTAELLCPKCQSPMRTFERNEVTLEQCPECRGIFLDRGEFERLIAAESAYVEASRRDQGADQGFAGGLDGAFSGGHDRGGHHGSSSRKRRKGFLGELFD